MIPKIIHLAWVGPDPKPQMVLDCIESWRRWCPDWEIREWGAEAIHAMGSRFASEAFAQRKWAFASDVLRLWVLREHGGVYLDSDLMLNGPLDGFLDASFFGGFEVYKGDVKIGGWMFGSERGGRVVTDLLAEYDGAPFVLPDGTFDMLPNTFRISRYFASRFGLREPYDRGRTERFDEGRVVIWPSGYFCAPEPGVENFATHLFNGAWLDSYSRKSHFRIGRLEFARFRREKGGRDYPLYGRERLLLLLPTRLSGRKKLAVILR